MRLGYTGALAAQGLFAGDDVRGLGAAGEHPVGDGVNVLFVRLAKVDREALNAEALFTEPVRDGAAIQAAGNGPGDVRASGVQYFSPVQRSFPSFVERLVSLRDWSP